MTAPVLERESLAPIPAMGAWIAQYDFDFEGLNYNYFFACGMLGLAEVEAREIMEGSQYQYQARTMFLRDVRLLRGPTH